MSELIQPRIFLHELYWDMRSRNTDWRYVRFELPKLGNYDHDLTLTTEKSLAVTLLGNAKVVRAAVGRRVGLPPSLRTMISGSMDRREFTRSKSNMIFSKEFPLNAGDTPVIWESGLIDREMCRSYGADEASLDEEHAVRSEFFRRATVVKLFADAEQRRHAAMFPDISDRFVSTPHFFTHVTACPRTALEKHIDAETVRIFFVGNNATRKGLDLLFDAFLQLPASIQNRAHLTVISHFDRSRIVIPQHERIVVLRGAPSERVMQEMRAAHILVNVARFESYGIVFHEGMSQGCACVGPNWEVQRELLDEGRAGMNLPCSSEAIKVALERLIEDEPFRYKLALAGWTRFQERYAPARVAEKYAAMFRGVASKL